MYKRPSPSIRVEHAVAGVPRTRGFALLAGTSVIIARLAICCLLGLGSSLARGAPGVAHPGEWPSMGAARVVDPATEARVEGLLAAMTLEEKIGQLVQADIDSIRPEDLRKYPLGSILAGGNAAPDGDVRTSAAHWRALMDEFHRESRHTGSNDAPIPVLIGIDAVHGHARVVGGTVFPHNVGLGATHDAALVEEVGRATAAEVAATGIDWTFAPTIAVVRDVRWGRSYESFSEDPHLVAELAQAMVVGLQGRLGTAEFLAPGRVLASIKHFLGDGGTRNGRDQFDNHADERTLRTLNADPYRAALRAGAVIVMASYNSWNGAKMHANASLLTGVLKDRWSFPGFVVGDWNAQEEVPGCTKFSCPAMLSAGLDMYMAPDSWKRLYANLLAQARDGAIAITRVDDAVRRILRTKALFGLLKDTAPAGRTPSAGLEALGSAAHRAIARDAVRKSLVLLKNESGLVPLDPRGHVLVTGPGADDIGMQCGGWTIDWQGDHNRNADFPGGTSIYAGIKAAIERAGGSVELSTDGSFRQRPAAAVVVYGEKPYAEFEGDRETLEFAPGGGAHLELLRRLHEARVPIVSVFLSGRPLWVNRELNLSDSFIAAWLPGTEGEGIADLLFRATHGEPARDFSGRLGFSWPATAMPVSFDAAGVASGALFSRGYGLTVGSPRALPHLPENPKAAPDRGSADTLFSKSHVTAPWSIFVADRTAQVRLTMAAQASPEHVVAASLGSDAVRATWSGEGAGDFWIGGRASSYVDAARGGTDVVVRYAVDVAPTQAIGVGVRCDPPYGTHDADGAPIPSSSCGRNAGALLDLTETFRAAPRGKWRSLRVPLACLAGAGADLSNVSAPFSVKTAGQFKVRFEEIRFERAPTPRDCPPEFQ